MSKKNNVLNFSDFGLQDGFWHPVELIEPNDDGSENAIEFRVNFKRRTTDIGDQVREFLTERFDDAGVENDTRLADALAEIEDSEKTDTEKKSAVMRVRVESQAAVEKEIAQAQLDVIPMFINEWDLKTSSGVAVDFNDAQVRESFFRLFPSAPQQLRDLWGEVTSRAALEKNSERR